MRRILFSWICASVLFLPGLSFPWGDEGHKIVTDIARLHLTEEARALIATLLSEDEAENLTEASTWADDVRRSTHRHTYPYHFVNIASGENGLDMARDCGDPEKRCVVWAIEHYGKIFQDRERPVLERREALKFLVHFIGDIHQPLHCGRLEDRGGNSIEVTVLEDTAKIRLHGFWDYGILEYADITWPASVDSLHAQFSQAAGVTGEDTNPVQWANESYRLCETYVYDITGNHLDETYCERAAADAKKRLVQAGLRLATVINSAVDGTLTFE
jgi:hypothetical protein